MDVEKEERSKLCSRFSEWFEFEQHVQVYSKAFNKYFQVDVVGQPKSAFEDLVFAFEVKNKPYWKPANLSASFKQAADYVYCKITSGRWQGRVINSAYVYMPADGAAYRDGETDINKGIEYLAEKFRVGTLVDNSTFESEQSLLKMRNEFWRSETGFNAHARGILKGQRPIGGTKVKWDVLQSTFSDSDPNSSTVS